MASNKSKKNLLWWGRFDPNYSRNRILRRILINSGYEILDFIPKISRFGRFESYFHQLPKPDAVWVPAFRHRDFRSARSYAAACGVPLIFDPLISSWDKAVFERKKFSESDHKSKKLLAWEQSLLSKADLVIADTAPHAAFYIETLHAPAKRTHVVPVGAEEPLFSTQPHSRTGAPEILFYGSFINLQGPQFIVEAAKRVPHVNWVLLGEGPLRKKCKQLADAVKNIRFEQWISYEQLPIRIGKADILLGIFGTSPKAGRVIPNKVFQSLACGRPVITRYSEAYPSFLSDSSSSGIAFVPPGNPEALSQAVLDMLGSDTDRFQHGKHARTIYDEWFSETIIRNALECALASINV